jgi:RNA polymerase primary sigma factor
MKVFANRNHSYAERAYYNDIKDAGLLTPEEEKALFKKMKAGDRRARDKIVLANQRLVISIAAKYLRGRMEFLDLVQEGQVGLIKALEKFDCRKGWRFSTYATRWITQTVIRACKNQGRNIRLPEHRIGDVCRLEKAELELTQIGGKAPSIAELALYLSWPAEKVSSVGMDRYNTASLEAPSGEDGGEFGDFIADRRTLDPAAQTEKNECMEAAYAALDADFSPLEGDVFRARHGLLDGEEHTYMELGAMFGMSHESARQIEKSVQRRLQDELSDWAA